MSFGKFLVCKKHGLLKVNKNTGRKTMQNIENKEYYTLLGLTKQGRNDIIITYETMRNKNEG